MTQRGDGFGNKSPTVFTAVNKYQAALDLLYVSWAAEFIKDLSHEKSRADQLALIEVGVGLLRADLQNLNSQIFSTEKSGILDGLLESFLIGNLRRKLRSSAGSGEFSDVTTKALHSFYEQAAYFAMVDQLVLKSINEVLRSYSDTLTRWVVDAANGTLRASGIAAKFRKFLIESGQAAYIEGMREGGVKNPEIDGDDQVAINEWIISQTPHLYKFADDAVAVSKLKGSKRTAARAAMLDRVRIWTQALESLGQLAVANTKGNPMLTFEGDDGEESCDECQKYKGMRKRKSWWEKRGLLMRNGNENYGCRRFDNCHHFHYYDNGSLAL